MKQNFIELISAPFGAGESRLWMVSGQYFELIDATNPVDVILADVNGAQRGRMAAAEASFNLKNTDFQAIQITSPTAQTIRFAYGSGEAGTRRAAGSVNVANAISIAPGQSLALVQATIDALRVPRAPNGIWTNTTAMVANTAKQVFAPASNVNGAILHAASANESMASSGFSCAFLAKASAPANVGDGDPLLIGGSVGTTGSVYAMNMALPTPQFIPAGLGLYYISSTAPGGARGARYELL